MRRRIQRTSRLQCSVVAGALVGALCACDSSGEASGASTGAGIGAAAGAAATGGVTGGSGGAAASGGGAGGASPARAGAGAAGAAQGGAGASGAAGSAGTAGSAGSPGSAGTAGGAGAAGAAGGGPTPGMPCDRACLTEFNDAYLAALIANDATMLELADGVRFTENGEELRLDQGLWAVARSLREFRQDFAEVPAGQTAGFAALDDDGGAVLLAFRLEVVDRQVTEIETIVVRQGEATFFSPSGLSTRDPLYDMEVPAPQRLSRDELIEIVDSYFMGIETGDGSAIPVDASAARNENGTVTARGASIQNLAMFSYIETVTRRYVLVDEERGNVLPFVLFEIPMGLGGSRTLHLAELFKVQDGEIMDILAIMVNQPLGTPSGWQ